MGCKNTQVDTNNQVRFAPYGRVNSKNGKLEHIPTYRLLEEALEEVEKRL